MSALYNELDPYAAQWLRNLTPQAEGFLVALRPSVEHLWRAA